MATIISGLCLLATFALTSAVPSCGMPKVVPSMYNNGKMRIVGGAEARPHSHPWIVSLQRYTMNFCGGTLVRVGYAYESDIVISAAHCFEKPKPKAEAMFGGHDQVRPSEGQIRIPIDKVEIHPEYKSLTKLNDVAVIKLSRPVQFSDNIQPACLPQPGDNVTDGEEGIVAGWGKLTEGGSSPNPLNQVILPTIDADTCKKTYSFLRPDMMVCAGYPEGGYDSCQGDSGGPFVFKRGERFTLHGIVSFGFGCGRKGVPGIYARVSNYREWIDQKISEMTSVPKYG